MKFSALKNTNEEQAGNQTMSEYLRTYLHEDRLKKIDEIRDYYVKHLFEDISSIEAPFDFESFLRTHYVESNNHAGDCIRLCLYAKDIIPREIKYWTDAALKCFDCFLLIYIQDVCHETIKSFSSFSKETDVYEHLIKKGGDAQVIGEAFKYIYQYRNKFFHIQHVVSNGRREIVKTSNKQYKQMIKVIMDFFKNALVQFKLFNHPVIIA
jgi:hypothetical protein